MQNYNIKTKQNQNGLVCNNCCMLFTCDNKSTSSLKAQTGNQSNETKWVSHSLTSLGGCYQSLLEIWAKLTYFYMLYQKAYEKLALDWWWIREFTRYILPTEQSYKFIDTLYVLEGRYLFSRKFSLSDIDLFGFQ